MSKIVENVKKDEKLKKFEICWDFLKKVEKILKWSKSLEVILSN